jgi:outer membrane biosynthesis protein TonB
MERRHSARHEVPSLVYLVIEPGNGGILHDVNECGMRVSMANPLAADAGCRFSIVLQNQPPIQGVARVAWLSESGKAAGLQFVELPEDSRRQIRQWVESNAQEPVTGKQDGADTNTAGVAGVAATESQETEPKPDTASAAAPKAQTPLFFLPQKQTEEEPKAGVPAEEASLPPAGVGPVGIEQVRLTLTKSSPSGQERKKKRVKQELLFAVRVVAVAALFLVGGFVLNYKGGDAVQYVKRHAPLGMTFSHLTKIGHLPSWSGRKARGKRRSRSLHEETTVTESKAGTPRIWVTPQEKVPLRLEVTDSFNRRWLITDAGQPMIPVDRPRITEQDVATSGEPYTQPAAEAANEPAGPVAQSSNSAEPGGAGMADEEPEAPSTLGPPNVQPGVAAPFTVVLDARIGEDGSVKDVRVVSSPSTELAWAVVEAVKQWHYPPFYRNGHPAEVVTRITVAFRGSTPK